MSAHLSQKPQVQTSSNFCMLPVAMTRSSSNNNATFYVVPVLWMT